MGLRAMSEWDSGKCEILCAEWGALGHTWQLGLHAPFRAVGLCHAAAQRARGAAEASSGCNRATAQTFVQIVMQKRFKNHQ